MLFNERLKLLRMELNLKQEELADILGVSRQAISHYETGERQPDFNILIIMSKYFHVSVDFLIGISDIRNLDEKLLFENLNNTYKGASPVIISILEAIYDIIEKHKNDDKLRIFEVILKSMSEFTE